MLVETARSLGAVLAENAASPDVADLIIKRFWEKWQLNTVYAALDENGKSYPVIEFTVQTETENNNQVAIIIKSGLLHKLWRAILLEERVCMTDAVKRFENFITPLVNEEDDYSAYCGRIESLVDAVALAAAEANLRRRQRLYKTNNIKYIP